MKIHSISLCRNEADIIERTLLEAARWSDFIYVYDNGSTDGTWEKVIDLAATSPRIIPFRSERVSFNDNLRRVPFAHFRDRADPSLYADEVPLELKCRYYSATSSEIRFFKYHPRLLWHTGGFPYPLLKSFEKRIRLKHYQYRSPQQIEQRLATRRDAVHRGMFRHERRPTFADLFTADVRKYRRKEVPSSWTSRVVHAASLTRDDGANYLVLERSLPRIIPVPDSPRRRLRRAWRRRLARLASETT